MKPAPLGRLHQPDLYTLAESLDIQQAVYLLRAEGERRIHGSLHGGVVSRVGLLDLL